MKLESIYSACKDGKHGLCEHGVYSYNNHTMIVCLECQKEKTKIRRQDPKKRKQDADYTKRYYLQNRDLLREKERIKSKQKIQQRINSVHTYFEQNYVKINQILNDLDYPVDFCTLKNKCARFGITDINHIAEYALRIKVYSLKQYSYWTNSSLVKYHNDVRRIYAFLPESRKVLIRRQYKEIVKNEISNYLSKIKNDAKNEFLEKLATNYLLQYE